MRPTALWVAAVVARSLALGAQPAVSVTNTECSLTLSAGSATAGSVAVQATPLSQPPFRVQLSTNLADWIDWKWVTNRTARFVLADGSLPPAAPVFFQAKPMGIDLTNWKLTLPVNTSRPGSPDEIKQPELASYQDAAYFRTNSLGRGIVLSAPCGGTSTSNSVFPRSELHEMANGGRDRAAWSTTSGTHTLEIVQAITHLPEVKPDVAAGQIHDADAGLVLVKLQSRKLSIFQNGIRGPLLTDQYRLGDPFAVKFVVRGGRVESYYNGQHIDTYPLRATNCYFKAGCYTLSNTNLGDAPSAFSEVVIYGLSVTHEP
jgi:poly(beta-D-mannuronate) lyase